MSRPEDPTGIAYTEVDSFLQSYLVENNATVWVSTFEEAADECQKAISSNFNVDHDK
jgi:hypothetical protein